MVTGKKTETVVQQSLKNHKLIDMTDKYFAMCLDFFQEQTAFVSFNGSISVSVINEWEKGRRNALSYRSTKSVQRSKSVL